MEGKRFVQFDIVVVHKIFSINGSSFTNRIKAYNSFIKYLIKRDKNGK